MTSRTRLWVLAVSTPVIAFAIIGGYLGQALAKDDTYQHLRVFEDVVPLVLNNYVEQVDVRAGDARRDARAGRRPRPRQRVTSRPISSRPTKANASAGAGRCRRRAARGRYYLRVVSARDGSPAAKAGLRTGDFIRGHRRPSHARHVGLRRQPPAAGRAGQQGHAAGASAATPPIRTTVDLVRERSAGPELTSRMADADDRLRPRRASSRRRRRRKLKQAYRCAGQDRRHAVRRRPARHRRRRPRRRHRRRAAVRARAAR